jgi:hypothetical protein
MVEIVQHLQQSLSESLRVGPISINVYEFAIA